jgi:iron complex outermembrane recepter protein
VNGLERNIMRAIALGAVSTIALSAGMSRPAASQTAPQQLAPVVVQESAAKRKPTAASRRAATARSAASRRANSRNANAPQAVPAAAPAREIAWGHVDGYVATRSGSGTKTDTPLIETPQSVSVVTQDQIQAQGLQSIAQAVRYVPGTRSEVLGSDGRFDQVYIRGFLADQYLDSMRLVNFGIFGYPIVEPFNLERVEVLRGPSSILYGQASPGGVVNMVSKRPTEDPYHEMFVSTGSYGRVQSGVDLSGPLDKNKEFLYRLTASGYDVGSQVDTRSYQRVSIAPSLTWRPDNQTTLTIQGVYQRDPKAGFYNQLLPRGVGMITPYNGQYIPTSFFSGQPGFDRTSRDFTSIGYQFEHKFDGGLTVRQNLRYMDNASYSAVTSPDVNLTDPTKLTRGAYTTQEAIRSFSMDNQAEGKFRVGAFEHTVLFGIDYRYATDNAINGSGTATTINALNPVYGPSPIITLTQKRDQKIEQLGFYAQDQITFNNWVALLGIRRDQANSKSTSTSLLTNAITAVDQTDSATSKRGALLYKFDNGISPYVQYTESFQPAVGTGFNGLPFVPTRGQQYEAGIKYQPNAKSIYTMALFDLKQQNVLTTDLLHPLFSVQTGEIRSRGLELEAKTEVTRDLTVLGSYTYLDQKVTSTNNAAQLGQRPTGMPRHSANLWADYTFHSGPLDGFGFSAGVRYLGDTAGNNANTFFVPSVTLVDAGLHYDFGALNKEWKGFTGQVNANNLFDKTYVTLCQDFGCYYGLRREVIATLRYRW